MLGDRIKELRTEKDIFQQQLADKLGVSKSTVAMWETNKREPDIGILNKLADFFNCSIDYLLERTNDCTDESVLDKALAIDIDLLQKHGNLLDAQKAQDERDGGFSVEQLFADTATRSEIEHITKFRSLDSYGKRAVSSVLDVEYERCQSGEAEEGTVRYINIRRSLLPASAGAGAFLEDENIEIRSYPDTSEARQADIVIPVDGKSMEPLYHNGDELYVRLQPAVEIGEIGIFLKGEKGYVKKFGEDRLISINPEFEDIFPDGEEPIICKGKVLGKVEKE